MPRRQPTSTLFPYTTLFRSALNLEQAIQMAKGSSAMSVVRVFLAALLAFACAQAPMAAHGGETASTHKGSADLTLPFGLGKGLHPAWGNGAIPGLYTPDRSEGAFRFTCGG